MNINEILFALNEALEQEFTAPFFPGFYESIFTPQSDDVVWHLFNNPNNVPDQILDWCEANADIVDYEAYEKEVCKAYIDEVVNTLQGVLPNFRAEFVEMESPKEYNNTTDRCFGKCNWEEVKNTVKKYIAENRDAFKKWIKDNHSSYSGFISFYDNDADKWDLDGELDYNEVGSILGFIINNEGKSDLSYAVYEDVNVDWDVDLEELKKNFTFDVEPESLSDLENYVFDEENNVFKLNIESPGQQKLSLEKTI